MRNGKALNLSEFRGVDFSNSPLRVKQTRAANVLNFYLDDEGRMRKRPGWRELLCIRDEQGEPLRINGVFEYNSSGHRDVIVHAGKRFFRLTLDENGRECAEDITESGTHELSKVDASRLTDERSQAFFMTKKMYIIGCGDYLVYGSWDDGKTFELRRVYEGEDTYIPTTTVGIGAEFISVSEEQDDEGNSYWHIKKSSSVTDEYRDTLDGVNLLTRWRKNKLQGFALGPNGTDKYGYYQLDAIIDGDANIEVVNELTGERFESANYSDESWYFKNRGKLVVKGQDKEVGYFFKGTNVIFLDPNHFPEDNGDSVITVTFRHTPTAEEAGVEEEKFVKYEDRIGMCRFGILYGIDGNVDRLFLAGNPEFDNVEFFSEHDDATYFSDLNTIAVGFPGQSIVGYARLSDNTLAVFKERGNGEDANIFYHTGYYKQESDDRGNLLSIDAIFPTTVGNVGHTIVSRHACADFGGDPLILSTDGVFGIVLSENISTADRYTRERSRSVNARLCREKDLSEAVAICHGGRYYLAVNSHVYVADSRTKYYADKDADGSYQYEWWYWEGIPARVLCELEGALCFGTVDGRLCVFDEQRSDRTHTDIVDGALTVDIENNELDCAESLAVSDGDRIVIDTDGLYALYATSIRIEDGRVFVSEDDISYISDGVCVFADGKGLDVGKPYKVDDVDAGECSFLLKDENGNQVVPASSEFRLYLLLTGRELTVCGKDESTFGVKLWKGGERLTLTVYNGEVPSSPVGRILKTNPIRALWVSGMFDLGSASHDKTLLSISVTTEPGVKSSMSFGYVTRREVREYERSMTPGSFSFEDLSFHEFSFSTGFAQSCTKRIFDRSINYIAFRVRSEDGDCALGALEAIYKFNRYQGGIR